MATMGASSSSISRRCSAHRVLLAFGCALLSLACVSLLCAQELPPPQLGPTVSALEMLQDCGQKISKAAPSISADLLDAQQQLFFGLAKGGYADPFGFRDSGGGQGYQRNGKWLSFPPPKDYVAHEAEWCQQVAEILKTDPSKAEPAKQVLASIAKDLQIKVKDCRAWGAGRLITVIANTIKSGQPDPGWTVMYKWVSVSGLNSMEMTFPQVSTPTSKGVPPGIYSVYATKQVGDTVMKTQPVTVSAFQSGKVKCEIPVP